MAFKAKVTQYRLLFKLNCQLCIIQQLHILPQRHINPKLSSISKKKPTRKPYYNPHSHVNQQIAHTASCMRKPDLTDNDQSQQQKISHYIQDDEYAEKVENVMQLPGSEIRFKSVRQLAKDNDDSPTRKISSSRHLKMDKDDASEDSSKDSQASRMTTTEEMLEKYDIVSIMKRKHQKEEKHWKSCKTFGKVLLIILLFPFSLIWLLASHLRNRKVSQSPSKQSQANQSQLKSLKNPSILKPAPLQSHNKCTFCLNSCCQTFWCSILCCQCCDQCRCCNKCCRKCQKCLQKLCQNSLLECLENCFYKCFIKGCEKCWKCICCRNRKGEKLDTIQRLDRMRMMREAQSIN